MNNPLETHHIYIQQTQNVNILNGKHVLGANEIETHDTNVDADVCLYTNITHWRQRYNAKPQKIIIPDYFKQMNFCKFLFTQSMLLR